MENQELILEKIESVHLALTEMKTDFKEYKEKHDELHCREREDMSDNSVRIAVLETKIKMSAGIIAAAVSLAISISAVIIEGLIK